MIVSVEGKVAIEGSRSVIWAEFTSILDAFFKKKMFSKEEIEKAIRTASMSDEDLESEIVRLFKEVLSEIEKGDEDDE